MTTEFPGNSKNNPRPQPQGSEPKKVESVVTGEVQARKRGLFKRFKDVFIGGDSRSVVQYVVMDVLVPQAKDMITEAASQGFERLIYGEHRPRNRFGSGARPPGPTNYTRYSVRGNNPIGRSGVEDRRPTAQARSHTIDDILLATRVEAETVLDRMYDLLREYEVASVADLHSLVGWSSSYVDQKWGWVELNGANVQRTREGYILNLPKPQSIE